MQLSQLRIVGIAPFRDLTWRLDEGEGAPPPRIRVVYGAGGTGKTTLLSAIDVTRPGHAAVLRGREFATADARYVAADWTLGADDPTRPHPLRVMTPTSRLGPDATDDPLQRREQAHYEQRAREGGFGFVAFPTSRWFPAQPIVLAAPGRAIHHFDPRAPSGFEDTARADLARDTKQVLAYASFVRAHDGRVPGAEGKPIPEAGTVVTADTSTRLTSFAETVFEVTNRLVQLSLHRFVGVDPRSLEPLFLTSSGERCGFDALPTGVRHLAALAALTVRMLHAAHPEGPGRPRRPWSEVEGVVLVDELDLHQDPAVKEGLLETLRAALPSVQWIVTTRCPRLAGTCPAGDLFALERDPETGEVRLHAGSHARVH